MKDNQLYCREYVIECYFLLAANTTCIYILLLSCGDSTQIVMRVLIY